MSNLHFIETKIQLVSSFQELVSTRFEGDVNALCWSRELTGDFAEIANKIEFSENMVQLDEEELMELELSLEGQLARETLLSDMKLLQEHGASPILNVINYYEREDVYPFFSRDVYSFHVDRSPIPVDTFLCTYHGASSDILPNSQAIQKILVPEIRAELKKLYDGPQDGFESFLSENFFDLHYQAKPEAEIINLGLGHIWRLAIDHPESAVLPCLHRAPHEKNGERRLLLIC
jgi:hypothetical protein